MKTIRKAYSYIVIISCFWVISCSNDDNSPTFLGEVEWMKAFGGSEEDTARVIIETTDGGYAILGTTSSMDGDITDKKSVQNDYWLLKLDKEGNLQWNKTYGGSDDDRGTALIQTADGGYAIAGYSKSSDGDASNNEGQHDHWILKLDAFGTIQWQNSFGFPGHDHTYDILQTADGGYLLSGFLDITASEGQGNSGKSATALHGVGEFWILKLNSEGQLTWSRYFGGTNNDRAYSVVQSQDGSFVVSGFSESDDFDINNSKGSYDFWVVKVDIDGNLVWEQSFGGSGIEESYAIAVTKDNNYVIAGKTFSYDKDVTQNKGDSDVWIIKIDDNGNLLWEKTFGGINFDAAESIYPTKDGGFIISGNTRSSDSDVTENFGENDIWAFKINSKGTLVWEQSFGGSETDLGFDAIETSDRKIVIIGETQSTDNHITENKGKTDVLVVKLK